ncbi:hypothetical protein IJ531_07225, partial [bacterium]|nr:hypothetical protein [bacterium]
YLAKEMAKWTALTARCDFMVAPSRLKLGDHQREISKALKEAKKNWSENHRRTILFVEGMDRLLDTKTSNPPAIAIMKDLMQKADRAYHTTIFFYAQNPGELDPGTTTSNRICVEVNDKVQYGDLDMRYTY